MCAINQYKGDFKEEFFFKTSLPTITSSSTYSKIFKALHDFIAGSFQTEY